MSSYANFRPKEGTVTAEETLTFDFRCKRFLIINDSLTGDLLFKFNPSEDYGTLHADEQVSMEMNHKNIILKSSDGIATAAYRVWGIG